MTRRAAARRFAFLDAPTPLAFAHRGGAAGCLENSMTAFARAVDLGYRYLETDVHATADGVALAFHDRALDRVTDGHGQVAALPYSVVRRARIGGRAPIPTIEELLGAWPHVRVNLDVKAMAAVGPLARAIRRCGALDRVCVASFSESRLARIRAALGPSVCTALGPRAVLALRLASYVGHPRRAVTAPCAQVPVAVGPVPVVDPRFVVAAHRSGTQVHAWTIDDAAEMVRLLELGVDGIMTDDIDTLRDVLTARGAWTG